MIEEIEEIEEEEEVEEEEEEEDELVSADGSFSSDSVNEEDNTNQNTTNAFKSSNNGSSVIVNGSQQSMHTKTNHLNNDNNDVIRVSINGQPQRFSANTPINLTQTINKNTEPLSHSHSRINEHELMNKTSSHIDNNKSTQKAVSDNISNVVVVNVCMINLI